MRSMALRAVPLPDPSYETLQVASEGEVHSLHSVLGFLSPWHPELVRRLIEKYSKADEVVGDLCCGSGTFALQAALTNRIPFAAEHSALLTYMTRSLMQPADICQVALALQMLPITRPIDVSLYSDEFRPFFDLMTFREIYHIRSLVHSSRGFVERFLGLLTLSLLHGSSSSFLSTYSSPYLSLSPDAQELLNSRRGQFPTHRAAAPRILKKAAYALRDGIPSRFKQLTSKARVVRALPWDLSGLDTGMLSLTVLHWSLLSRLCDLSSLSSESQTVLEQSKSLKRGKIFGPGSQWIREWFVGDSQSAEVPQKSLRDLVNEVLLEAARVTRSQGRLVIELPGEPLCQEFSTIVKQDLARFWHHDSYLEYSVLDQSPDSTGLQGHLLVLRRLP